MLKTILLVDDDEALTDNLTDILSDEGYTLYSAATCADAVTVAAKVNPKVALLDLKLPDNSGIQLLANLKEHHPDCICALMTAFADLDSAVNALEKGAFHYLQKPVRPVELINLLQRIFEIIQIREEKRLAEERLKESEKRFRTIFESARDAIYIKDTNLKYTLVNPAMERLHGFKADAFIGRSDEEIFGQDISPNAKEAELRVLGGEIIETEEIRWVGRNKKTFHNIKVPMGGGAGTISGLCGFERDLTATKQLEAQLLQAQKMEAIGILAGGVSHDFNNLLQAVMGYTHMLLNDREAGHPDFARLKAIEKAAERATDLTRQLLTFGRKVEINPRPVDVNYVIRQVETLLKRTIPKMIAIELRLTDSVHTVNADPGQLEQVLLNIGINAKDAMSDGGQLIFETANFQPDDAFRRVNLNDNPRPYVLITIRDNGHGMSEEVLEHIFEPFFTTKQAGQGTGLGLAIAYGIIKNHQGHLACASTPGVGTTFSIYLPAIDAIAQPEAAHPVEPIRKGIGEKVLVIDDEPFLRDLANDMLVKNGYEVIMAGSGEEGLTFYRQQKNAIALIILDLIMPGMGGKQCMAEILNFNPKAKILISSGYTMDNPKVDKVLSRAKGFIAKPYNFREMLRVMREVIAAK
ncbi:MAG: response regulator [Desulfobacteraceae bacterium]|nr:response regulator [Desulfobacteraceae bacterium]